MLERISPIILIAFGVVILGAFASEYKSNSGHELKLPVHEAILPKKNKYVEKKEQEVDLGYTGDIPDKDFERRGHRQGIRGLDGEW